jgi:hypothetical protein
MTGGGCAIMGGAVAMGDSSGWRSGWPVAGSNFWPSGCPVFGSN